MNKRVLIVEDEKDLAVLMSYQLSRVNIDAFRAANGWQGLNVLEEVSPDLIISDIGMPEMDGYELCKRLEEKGVLQKIPVIILTGYVSRIDEFRALGIKEFLIKPFDSAKLIAAIDRVFDGSSASQVHPPVSRPGF